MAALILPRTMTAQPQYAAPLTPQYAKWEHVFNGPTGAKNLGSGGVDGTFSGTAGGRGYSPQGVGYFVGQAASAAGGLQISNSASAPTVYSGLIVFTRDGSGLTQGLFDSAATTTFGFYIKAGGAGFLEIDKRNNAAIAASDVLTRVGVNVAAWTHDLNNLTFALNGTVKTISDPSTVYTWSATPSFGSPFGGENVTHQQHLSAVTVTQSLTPAELVSLTLNPWQIFKAMRRSLWVANAAVQLLRPGSDITAGTWTPSSGASLFATLNEAVASDATFDLTSQASTFEVGMTAGTAPGVTTGHVVRYRIVGAVTVSLRQGTTTIASWSQAPTAMTTYVQTLTSVQAAAITNYAALKLQFQAT